VKFVYTPEGLEPKKWEFEPGRLMSPECMAIEKLTGMSFSEWQKAFLTDSITAQHAYLWVMLKRENPVLTAEQVQFMPAEIGVEWSDEEARTIRDALDAKSAASGLDIAEAQVLVAVRGQVGETRPDSEPEETEGAPKDPETA
jgi:hypothetical protein